MNRPRETQRILVVEDDEAILELAKRVLLRAGYRVVGVRDGLDAWRVFQRNPDAFDLIFVDMILPRLHGLRLGGRIRELRPRVPVLYTSGFTPFGQAPQVNEDARTIFLAKPYGPRLLLDHVQQLLAVPKAAAAEA